MESLADKMPWVDSLWDRIHAFLRPAGAALIAFAAVGRLDLANEIAVILLCGEGGPLLPFGEGGGRLSVNQTPEPFSNILPCMFEDVLAVAGGYATIAHPITTLAVVVVFLALFALLARGVYRRLRRGTAPG